MGRTAPPGRPKTVSTPSRLRHSSTIRAPDVFTALLLEQAGGGQDFLDVLDGVGIRRRQRRTAGPAIEALQVEGGLEAADAVTSGDATVGRHHADRDLPRFLPATGRGQRVYVAPLPRRDGAERDDGPGRADGERGQERGRRADVDVKGLGRLVDDLGALRDVAR